MKLWFFSMCLAAVALGENNVLTDKRDGEPDRTLVAPMKPVMLYEQDPTLLTSSIQLVFLSGSLNDPPGKGGVHNLLSDLLLRGTKKRSRSKFQVELEKMGAAVYTRVTHDAVFFTGKVIREKTGAFIQLLQEAITEPSFSAKEFKDLKSETLSEIANLKNSNNRLAGLALRKHTFAGTALERPVQGGLSTVAKITRDDVMDAYKKYFRQGNLIIAGAGPFPEAEMKEMFKGVWKNIPAGMTARSPSLPPQIPTTPKILLVHKPQTSTGVVMMGQAGLIAKSPDRYTLATGNFSFGGEPLVSRLFKIIRGELGWTYAVGSSYHGMGALTNQTGYFIISATPSVEFTTKTILKSMSMWRDYLDKGPSSDELALAQESLVNSYPFDFESAEKRVAEKLYSYLYEVPILQPEEFSKKINDISTSKIRDALERNQTREGWWISVVADKDVIEKQLATEQASLPEGQRIKIEKVLSPDEVIR